MYEELVEDFSNVLERAGYKDARNLVENELILLARTGKISILAAAYEYAEQDEEQDTGAYQLFHALQRLSVPALASPTFNRPL